MSDVWERVPLRDLCSTIQKMDPADTGRSEVRYIDISSVDGSRHSFNSVGSVAAKEAPSRCRQVVQAGDTVFSTVRPYLEKIALVDSSLHDEFASTGFAVLRPGERLDAKFLYYFATSDQMLQQVLPMQRGVSYPAVTDRQVRETLMRVPPLDEQRRLVDLLDDHLSRLDASLSYLSVARRRLDSLTMVALANCRDGEPRPLVEVAEIQGGIQKQPKRAPRSNAFPFLRVANVTSRGLDLADVHSIELFDGEVERLRLEAGDLLVVEGNGSASQIGRAALWDGSIDDCVHQNHLIRVRPGEELLPGYLEAVWNSPQNRRSLMQVASSSSGLHTLSVTKLKALSVPVPSIDRQQILVAALSEVRRAEARLSRQVAAVTTRAESLRRGLLSAAFSGRLTGHTSDDRVAELAKATTE